MLPTPPDTPYQIPPRFLPIGNSPELLNYSPQETSSTDSNHRQPQSGVNLPLQISSHEPHAISLTAFQGASQHVAMQQLAGSSSYMVPATRSTPSLSEATPQKHFYPYQDEFPEVFDDGSQETPSTNVHGPARQFHMNHPSQIFGQESPATSSTGSFHQEAPQYSMTQQPTGSTEYDPSQSEMFSYRTT
eukprot:Platyproteum_vivax@DN6833_c0_g1_i1.p1